jgi:hypothetical protein
MGQFGLWYWIVVAAFFGLLFLGRGTISELMGSYWEAFHEAMAEAEGKRQSTRASSYDLSFVLLVCVAGMLAILLAYAMTWRLFAR